MYVRYDHALPCTGAMYLFRGRKTGGSTLASSNSIARTELPSSLHLPLRIAPVGQPVSISATKRLTS
jgi:hypothetical protein